MEPFLETLVSEEVTRQRFWGFYETYPLTRNYYENNSLRIFFVSFEAFCPLEMSRTERHFQGITREIRNFSENNYFRVIFRK